MATSWWVLPVNKHTDFLDGFRCAHIGEVLFRQFSLSRGTSSNLFLKAPDDPLNRRLAKFIGGIFQHRHNFSHTEM